MRVRQPLERRYWLTPDVMMGQLRDEFNFDFDPCPHHGQKDSTG